MDSGVGDSVCPVGVFPSYATYKTGKTGLSIGGRSETYECEREAASLQDIRAAIRADVPGDIGCEETFGSGLPEYSERGSDLSPRRGKRLVY